MAEKKSVPAPIDQPLGKAYIREFTGWSTAYAPGLSDPTSLRYMENVQIGSDGAAVIRPALRSVLEKDKWFTRSNDVPGGDPLEPYGRLKGLCSIPEPFIQSDGSKAYLAAVRLMSPENRISFRILSESTTEPGRLKARQLTGTDFVGAVPSFDEGTTYVKFLQIDNAIIALSDRGEEAILFFVGATKRAVRTLPLNRPAWNVSDGLTIRCPSVAWAQNPIKNTVPPYTAPTATSLISSDASKNVFNVAYFYTLVNEWGESAPSVVRTMRVQRPWGGWQGWGDNPSLAPTEFTDQLVCIMNTGMYDYAREQQALSWNLYMATWSTTDSPPVEALLIANRKFTLTGSQATEGWLQHTASDQMFPYSVPIPTAETRANYSDAPRASNGLVTGDRVILVNDEENRARIKWSSNSIGEYLNFSPSRGGGYKTLTTGNLQVPIAVELWQNPQSVDTITILCDGLDGYSTGYYMAPAAVNSQSENLSIMGFEETTATPGTVAPYGTEVFNNSLFHPLDDQLMKSSANNYNISHSSMTEDIANSWRELRNKRRITSAQSGGKLYYVVNNPDGVDLEDGCLGNEIWVYDVGAGSEAGTWSRYTIQAVGLRNFYLGGRLRLCVIRPEGILALDDQHWMDQSSPKDTPFGTVERPISWLMLSNTQGANRAHDAWCNLQQIGISMGNFSGTMQYGIHSWSVNGKPVREIKTLRQPEFFDWAAERKKPFDLEDYLQVKQTVKEWSFYASSTYDEDGKLLPSFGQISLVQYRYTPASVNIGYENGSIETFEYGAADNGWSARSSNNGIPVPTLDTSTWS